MSKLKIVNQFMVIYGSIKYFVIDPRSKERNDAHAYASREAMRTYAECIKEKNPELAHDLLVWADKEAVREMEL
jgi:hypothetical protein